MVLAKTRSGGMSLSPWQEINDMQNRIRQLFGAPFSMPMVTEPVGWLPAVDFSETETGMIVTAELPGMRLEDVHIELKDNVLTLRGEKREEKETTEKEMHLYERSYGSFRRSFNLPSAVDEAKVAAHFKDGVLTVTLPKVNPPKGREIQIKPA